MVPSKTVRIVVADDSSILREVVLRYLGKVDNFDVVAECEDGEQTIAAIKAYIPDVLLLDISMPILDGVGVLKYLKNLSECPTKTVVLTGYADQDIQEQCYANGAFICIEKGAPFSEIIESIKRAGDVAE